MEPDMTAATTQRRARTRRTAGRAQRDPIHDPYLHRQKFAEGGACPQCGAVYRARRWQWGEAKNSFPQLCPACRRINDRVPAGIVTLRTLLDRSRKNDMIGLARHQEEAEKGEHPLNRIIAIDETPEAIVVITTDIHLPRRIGGAVRHAFGGTLQIDFDEDGYFVRVNWTPA
jgi:hypothetical protein